MDTRFGQVVIGPPGSGKTSYCNAMAQLLQELGRKVAVVNLDPANESSGHCWAVDVMELITVEDAMTNLKLGPNGALIYAMEFLWENIDWLLRKLHALPRHYFLFDCPGQVELYTHHNVMKNILERFEKEKLRLSVVQLVDSHYCSNPGKYISTVLMSLSSMLQLGMPHVNVLSKMDLAHQHSDKLQFDLEFYMEVLDLHYLMDDDKFTKKYKKLNDSIIGLVEDYSLVSFLPLSLSNKKLLMSVRAAADKANGYVFGTGEERNVQALLACATGVEFPWLEDEIPPSPTTINQSEQLLWR